MNSNKPGQSLGESTLVTLTVEIEHLDRVAMSLEKIIDLLQDVGTQSRGEVAANGAGAGTEFSDAVMWISQLSSFAGPDRPLERLLHQLEIASFRDLSQYGAHQLSEMLADVNEKLNLIPQTPNEEACADLLALVEAMSRSDR